MERVRILLVDDEDLIRAVLSRELRLKNYDVQTAADGREALRLLDSQRFDAVITDLDMPNVDGISVLKSAKKMPVPVSVLILTGYGDLSSAIDALRLGADDYMVKPCDVEQLVHRLTQCLEKQDLLVQLQQQNTRLQVEIEKREQSEAKLRESEQRFQLALNASSDMIWDRNPVTDQVYFGEHWYRSLGYQDYEVTNGSAEVWEQLIHPDDKDRVLDAREKHFKGEAPRYEAEYRIKNKAGEWQWILARGQVIERDSQGTPTRVVGTHTDVTRLKKVEKQLQEARNELERRVRERTAELEETNIALNVLLAKRERDRDELEHQILSNVAELVEPYLLKLDASRLTKEQEIYLSILKANISELTSSLVQNIAAKFTRLTPSEIQVANLVKLGKRTKEIAQIMHLSPGTINIHRKNIRKKLGLTNKKENLQTFLSAYS